MAKKESSFFNMVSTLVVVTMVSAVVLGSAYALTKEPIRLKELEKKNNAISAVVPGFDNTPSEEEYKLGIDGDTLRFYPAKKDGVLIGTAVETFTTKGFGGTIKLMVGFKPDGTITDIEVLQHSETPGLGDKMDKKKSNFSLQFDGKNPATFKLAVKKDHGDVDAITASTISSRAFCDAVDRAYKGYMEMNTTAVSDTTMNN